MKLFLVMALAAVIAAPACNKSASATSPQPAQNTDRSDLLLVANKAEASLAIYDLSEGVRVKTLPTGVGPHEVVVSSDGSRAVVCNYGEQIPGNTLTVIDLEKMKIVDTIDLGEYKRPHGIAFLPGDRRVVLTSEVAMAVVVVDIDSSRVERSIKTDQRATHMLALAPNGRHVYTANIQSGSVTMIDLDAASAVKTVAVGGDPEGIGITPDGKEVWVGSNRDGHVRVLDAATLVELARVDAPGVPIRVTPTPDGATMLVTCVMDGKMHAFDRAGRTLSSSLTFPFDASLTPPGAPPGALPIGTVVSPDGKLAYVATMAADQVSIVDLKTNTIVGTLPTGKAPDGIAYVKR